MMLLQDSILFEVKKVETYKIVNAIAAAAQSRFSMRSTDYIKDGLVYCGICNSPRQMPFNGAIVPCMCRCDTEQLEREKQRREAQRVRDTIKHSPLYDSVFDRACFEHDAFPDSAPSRVCREYVAKWGQMENQGLMLYGEPGSGKSFLAACVVNALRRQRIPAQMCSVTRLLMSLDAWEREPIMSAIKSVPLLVLDDVGAERDTDYQLEKLFSVVDARIQSGRPLICTTNLTPAQMQEPDTLQKRRIYSRLWEACAVRLHVEGDKRPGIAQDKAAEARRVLLGKG